MVLFKTTTEIYMKNIVQHRRLLESLLFGGTQQSVEDIKNIKGATYVNIEDLQWGKICLLIYKCVVYITKGDWVVIDHFNSDINVYTNKEYLETFINISKPTYTLVLVDKISSRYKPIISDNKDYIIKEGIKLRDQLGPNGTVLYYDPYLRCDIKVNIKLFCNSTNDYEIIF